MKRSGCIALVMGVTCAIAAMGQPLPAQRQETLPRPQRLGVPTPPAACCSVTAIDSRSGIVTAKDNATSRTFGFRVTNAALLATLHPGSPVYANFSAQQVSLDGNSVCCSINGISTSPAPSAAVASAPAPPVAIARAPSQTVAPLATPQTATTPVPSQAAAPTVTPGAVGQIQNKPAPGGACCGITAIDFNTGTVSAKENATGKTFEFKVADSALLRALTIGQGVYASFAAKQVSLNGKSACCVITSGPTAAPTLLGPPTILAPLKPLGSSSANSGNSNAPQVPQVFSCGGTTNPLTADNCSKYGTGSTLSGFTATCGAAITITGNTFPAGSEDWLQFDVPPSRGNCGAPAYTTPFITVEISSSGGILLFDVYSSGDGSPPVACGLGQCAGGATVGVSGYAGLGSEASGFLLPNPYYIRIYGLQSTVGTWTLKIKS